MFGQYGTGLVFYGHHHPTADLGGLAHYVNPGSLGCRTEPLARFVIRDCTDRTYMLRYRAVPYNDRVILAALED